MSKFEKSGQDRIILFDSQNKLSDTKRRALEDYLSQRNQGICLAILDIKALPSEASLCLVATKV